ncbi:Zinc ABC transporter, periplasmic-binding protein ZnuA [hydrothermal vent metagenome]|uniref:Zinc ABC transporter, periplasmic-binding protein ZnuA n=1 Tax=hydrothermal vent metagenome TaxID=652676 RepID=A0A3B0XY96_9ZZZZ
MLVRIYHTFATTCLLLIAVFSPTYADSTHVLVSIKPLHSLISHITEGISQPDLLLSQQQSAHHFQLRPSQKRMINQADVFFYSSDNIEGFIPALKDSTENIQFIQLASTPGIKTLPARSFHSHTYQDTHHNRHADKNIDGHIWLSIENTILFSRYATDTLSRIDPQHATAYRKNLAILVLKLEKLRKDNQELLNTIKDEPLLIYHDAYQYFERENTLNRSHFITTGPEHTLGIRRIKALRQLIKTENIRCIFYEPPAIPPLLNTLAEDMPVKFAPLDPAGSQIPAGRRHYFELMRQTALTLYDCLKH